MEYVFTLEYEKDDIKEYEKRVLSMGDCESFLPMTFLGIGEKEVASYDYTGYQPLSCVEINRIAEALSCIEKLIFSMIKGEEYLIDPCKVSLSCSTVYYNTTERKIKIAYLPSKAPCENAGTAIIRLIEEFQKKYSSRQLATYLERVRLYAAQNPSLEDLINQVGALKREAHLCGII